MNCTTCGEPLKYAWSLGEYMTLAGYDSPPGHDHNDNCIVRTYACVKGHRQTVSIRRQCPACDWVGKGGCFCHEGRKVDRWPEEEKLC